MNNQLTTTDTVQAEWAKNIINDLNNLPDSIWDTKYYIILFKGLNVELIEAMFSKIALEIRLECEKIELDRELNDFDDDWAIQQMKGYFAQSFQNEYLNMMSSYYEKPIIEIIKDVKNLYKIHALLLDDGDEGIEIINDASNIFTQIEAKPTSYFRLMVFLIKTRNWAYRLEGLFKPFVPFKIPNTSDPIRKARAVIVQVLEDFIKRKIFNDWLEKLNLSKQIRNSLENEVLLPKNLDIRVITLRYIFQHLGVQYIGNETKVLKLIYFLLQDYMQVTNIIDTEIQNIYETQNLPCVNCSFVTDRNKAIEMFDNLGNQDLYKQVTKDNFCCKDDKTLENKLSFDISYIDKKDKQPHYAIIFDYLFKELGLQRDIEPNNKTRFVIWVTGVKNGGKGKISDHTMYDYLKNPLRNYNQKTVKNLQEVEKYLSGIGLKNIEEKIKKDFKEIKINNPNVKI